jgi:biotin carboxyl carrier protein
LVKKLKKVLLIFYKGDVLVIMEAMKMEHTIKSAIDGEVKEIRY